MTGQRHKLAATLRRRATDGLAIGIVAVITLSLGRWLATGIAPGWDLWRALATDARDTEPRTASDRTGSDAPRDRDHGATRGTGASDHTSAQRPPWRTHWTIRFGHRGNWQVERHIAKGDWAGIRDALVADCRTFLDGIPALKSIHETTAALSPSRLPESLAARTPAAHATGKWRIDVLTEGPPIVLGSIPAAGTSPEGWWVVWWSVAIPAGRDGWDVYSCRFMPPPGHPADASQASGRRAAASTDRRAARPAVRPPAALIATPPPGGRLVLHVGSPDAAETLLYSGTGTVADWCRHFDRLLARPSGSQAEPNATVPAPRTDSWQRLFDGSLAKTFRGTPIDARDTPRARETAPAERIVRVIVRSTNAGQLQALITATPP